MIYAATSASIRFRSAPWRLTYAPTIIDKASWMANRTSAFSCFHCEKETRFNFYNRSHSNNWITTIQNVYQTNLAHGLKKLLYQCNVFCEKLRHSTIKAMRKKGKIHFYIILIPIKVILYKIKLKIYYLLRKLPWKFSNSRICHT